MNHDPHSHTTHRDPHSHTTHRDPHQAPQADHGGETHAAAHAEHDMGSLNSMAASATLHCLTGCAIGEIVGLMIGTAAGLGNGWTIAISISLAFAFGYTLSTLPLLKAGLSAAAAFTVVLAADTLSIATMEFFDNLVMALIPGAMNAGLVNTIFWISMGLALLAAFAAAYPVNRYLLRHNRGHALTHGYHHSTSPPTGARRFVPSFSTSTLVAIIVSFMIGGLVVSIAAELNHDTTNGSPAATAPSAASTR